MSIGSRRLDDSQLPRLHQRPTQYYLVSSKLEEGVLRQRIVEAYTTEDAAIESAKVLITALVSDCRDWTPEELDNGSRTVIVD